MIRSKGEVGSCYDGISKFVQVMEGEFKAMLVHAFLASFSFSGLSRLGRKKDTEDMVDPSVRHYGTLSILAWCTCVNLHSLLHTLVLI